MTVSEVLTYVSNVSVFLMGVCIAFSFKAPYKDLEEAIKEHERVQLARMGIVFFSAVFLASMIAKEFV